MRTLDLDDIINILRSEEVTQSTAKLIWKGGTKQVEKYWNDVSHTLQYCNDLRYTIGLTLWLLYTQALWLQAY